MTPPKPNPSETARRRRAPAAPDAPAPPADPLALFNPAVAEWFRRSFAAPTAAQAGAWPALTRGDSTLLLAPTGSGKTLAAFLHAIDRLMFAPEPPKAQRCRVLYISPLKALAVDVERNLRAPIVGIANLAAVRGDAHRVPSIGIRTGDTPPRERARLRREPADILITTPESLYLMLTSDARTALLGVETVIIDEIHALVPSKRGAHLALSLERLALLVDRPLQRIGLSATQRPLDEVARYLGGVATLARSAGEPAPPSSLAALDPMDSASDGRTSRRALGEPAFRPVTLVDAGSKRALDLRVEVPVEDMAEIGKPVDVPSGPASQGPVRASIWTAIHPRLLDLVRGHRSTLIFVNSRRIAERLAAALNELAGETLVYAHHGSLAPAQRADIEDRLKAGAVRGLVATSSLELGIDMGAIDLVVQIEAPPSVASGLQRIGRAGHQVDARSQGVIFPKYRADLIACAAVTHAMTEGLVEPVRYPRNPIDVLAQHLVAMVAMEPWSADALYATVCRAAPFAALPRGSFDALLDMLAGRYESDDFAELRPRVTWDRLTGMVTAREGARRIAVANAGTIPDRGLYGVFLAAAQGRQGARVGELDEEMVFESRVGETFLLGASTWRIEQITHDRVLVAPAPGEPGKMPFWRGEAAGRTVELGRAVGALIRELRELPRSAARALLARRHGLDESAAENLLAYLADQQHAAGFVPHDRHLLIERYRDELGDFRICLLTPFGGRVHTPWAIAAAARIRQETGLEVETMATDDGFVVRFPDAETPPDPALLMPSADEAQELILANLGGTALFAARFREAAARALLLPRRHPGKRAPLWHTRRRAADLLAVAARQGSFPILLEAYRECLRDVFDVPSLLDILRAIGDGTVRLDTIDSRVPSPFASALLFGFVANYIYEGDAPLPERRAQALAIDQTQLRELLGEAELRNLLDAEAMAAVEADLQALGAHRPPATADGVHDLLLRLGDLTVPELARRLAPTDTTGEATIAALVRGLQEARRVVELSIAGERRVIAVENASRYRDAVGAVLPAGLPDAWLRAVADPLGDVLARYGRTHGPFTGAEVASRFGLPSAAAERVLARLMDAGKLVEGAFRPGGSQREWCAPEVLTSIRRRSLAKLRREVDPVDPPVLARALARWHGLIERRRGLDAILDAVEKLQGAPLPASQLESEILPARVSGYRPGDLDTLAAAGEVVWVGLNPIGPKDGRIALFLTDGLARLHRPPADSGGVRAGENDLDARERAIMDVLGREGASFFGPLHDAAGGGFQGQTVSALWSLVWRGLVTNDTFRVLRAFTQPRPQRGDRRGSFRSAAGLGAGFRTRRLAPPAAEGRWTLVTARGRVAAGPSATELSAALAQQLLVRYGVVAREVAAAEALPGGFSAVYETLKAMEERGRVRRGYFVTGIAAAQFALPAALDLLRSLRAPADAPEVLRIGAADPANPYGALLPWPARPGASASPTRVAGAYVVTVDGVLRAYLARGGRRLLTWLPEDEPERGRAAEQLAATLAAGTAAAPLLLVEEIDGASAASHPFAEALVRAGFVRTHKGLIARRPRGAEAATEPAEDPAEGDA